MILSLGMVFSQRKSPGFEATEREANLTKMPPPSAAATVPPQPPVDEFNKTFISGDWVYDISDCTDGTDNFWRFNRDNTYAAPGTFGTFSIKANTLYLKFDEPTDGKKSETFSIKLVNGGIRIGDTPLYKCPKSN